MPAPDCDPRLLDLACAPLYDVRSGLIGTDEDGDDLDIHTALIGGSTGISCSYCSFVHTKEILVVRYADFSTPNAYLCPDSDACQLRAAFT